MILSVIVPSFNAADTISAQLEALTNQQSNQPWEVIVADNGSRDETVASAQKYSTKIPSCQNTVQNPITGTHQVQDQSVDNIKLKQENSSTRTAMVQPIYSAK